MLEVKNLKKEYKTKGGVVTKALDDVSIKFSETGLVFLLGKSGSGKSTLLNVIGGLDKADSGEIIIKGKNSKEFTQSDFDSYRNTYIGFVFQEYNILNEFNIEQNISLALQLQGKKNNKEAVDDILKQVGLEKFGKRKPNTLSGGQKQRVAIARALIKNPEIIMADEPTGALDSNTGKQIFDTLKELSKEKLVIVVSHDRDFAEVYGDRIIELADGKITSDTSKEYIKTKEMGNIHVVNDHTLAIKDVNKVTKKDIDVILDNLKNQKGEVLITSGDHDLPLVRQAIHLSDDNSSEVFKDTKDVKSKDYDPKQTKFIRSHLPFSRAFKMGASYLKLKPVRLIFTSILTIISLTLFGVASTLLLFKDSYAYHNALKDAPYNSEVVSKTYKATVKSHRVDEDGNDEVYYTNEDSTFSTALSKEEIDQFNNNSLNLKFAPVMTFRLPETYYYSGMDNDYIVISEPISAGVSTYYQYAAAPNGFVATKGSYIDEVNELSLAAGQYPTKDDEVAVSSYASEYLTKAFGVSNENSLIGKTISVSIRGNLGNTKQELKIKGIIRTPELDSQFNDLKQDSSSKSSSDLRKIKEDFADYMKNDFATFLYVSEDFGESFINSIYTPTNGYYQAESIYQYFNGLRFSSEKSVEYEDIPVDYFSSPAVTEESAGDRLSSITFYNTSLEKTSYKALKEDEVFLSYSSATDKIRSIYRNYLSNVKSFFNYLKSDTNDYERYVEALRTITDDEADDYVNKIDALSNSLYDGSDIFDAKKFEQKAIFKEIKDFYEQYYYEYQDNQYLLSALNDYFYLYSNFHDQRIYPSNVLDIKDKKDAITADYDAYDFSEKETLVNYLTDDDEPLYIYDALNTWRSLYNQGILSELGVSQEVSDRMEALQDKFQYSYPYTYLTPSEIDEVKDFVDDLYERHPELEKDYSKPGFALPNGSTDFTPELPTSIYYKSYNGNFGELKVAGYFYTAQGYGSDVYFVNSKFLEANSLPYEEKSGNTNTYYEEVITDYKVPAKAYYSGMITPAGYSQEQIEFMQQEFVNSSRLNLTNSIARTVASNLSLINILKPTFLGIGAALGVFAALMLLNYVSTSIASKIKEIGILRAVGARGSDLFKIFFSESGLMSAICVVVSIIASIIVVWKLNDVFMSGLMNVALLNFGFLNVLLIIVGAILITVLGTIIPVVIAAKKQPVESIRTL